ncbi:UDP-glucose 4-epimerase GalE [Plantibacter sp. YIM 135249]|uniref:UDP-glucose 4-epimerase GalE n=1 Tax=Plantibacter sp. YIM 135249 TaxID=3423918 RepID=UPI003D358399
MSVLVTGGAGYIGSHVVRLLEERGERVVIVDDLSTGIASRVPSTPLVRLDLASAEAHDTLVQVCHDWSVDAVLHFAAQKHVGDSVADPTGYMRHNVGGLVNVLSAMESRGVDRLVFSSSAAVYGMPDGDGIREDVPCAPINPYGQTKLIGEWMTKNAHQAWGLRVANLRYFNVAGAGDPDLVDIVAQNLIPIVIDAVLEGRSPLVFGAEHGTSDGTCIRDYIHVADLAAAHLAALDFLNLGEASATDFNIGTGSGASVFEVVDLVAAISGRPVTPKVTAARDGDPASVVADASFARGVLGWEAAHTLEDIVRSAWEARVLSTVS